MGSRVQGTTSLINSIAGLAPLFVGSGKTTQTTSSLGTGTQTALASRAGGSEYSKTAAKEDSSASIQAILQKLMEQGAPQIGSAQRGSGVYNDTTSELLMNDLQARAVAQGAALEQQTVKDYANIQNQSAQILKGATTTTTSQTDAAIEDPWMAALKTAGVGVGASALSSLIGSIFEPEKKKKKTDDFGSDTASGGDFFSDLDLPQYSPSFDSNFEPELAPSTFQFEDSASGVNLPDLGSNIEGGSFGGGEFNGAIGSVLSSVAVPLLEALGVSVSSNSEGGISGGCFITTAICGASGLPDDCEALTVLREFRDSYMTETAERRVELQYYYEKAPRVVERIDAMAPTYSRAIYADLRELYIEPAIAAIHSGDNAKAHSIYKALVVTAIELSGV